MNKEIGIGILDLYTQEDVQNCWESIPNDLKENTFVVINNLNISPTPNNRKYTTPVPIATMRNWLISQMRIKGLKYYFLIHSNSIIEDPNLFENTIKLAESFGTWVILGNSTDNTPIEDDNGLTLNLSKHLNDEFLFIYSGIVKNNGYFDERYFNGKNLDVLDYVLKLRKKGVYPPDGYHPTISNGIEFGIGNINKIGFKDIPDTSKDVQMSYGWFMNNHKYIPTHNDPTPVSETVLLTSMETIQKNYGKK